ncbi:hypothetical protein ACX3OY_23525 [Citrobacter farmeri]
MGLDTEFSYPQIIDFVGTTLFHLCYFTEKDLKDYAEYNKYTEDNMTQSHSEVCEEVQEMFELHDEHHHEDILDCYSQKFQAFTDIYPLMHRKAMVITLYNFFENQIKTLCIEINKLLPKDMSDAYSFKEICIKRYRKFLRREADFDINQGNKLWELWEDMLKVEQIRHVLVHSEGEIEKHRAVRLAGIENYCEQKKGIRLIRHHIIIDEGYVAGLITELISLFKILDEQVKAFIRRYESEHGKFEVPLPPGASRTPL